MTSDGGANGPAMYWLGSVTSEFGASTTNSSAHEITVAGTVATWTTAAATFNGASSTIYANGAVGDGSLQTTSMTLGFWLFKDSLGDTSPVGTLFAEAIVWPYALTASQYATYHAHTQSAFGVP